MQSLGQCTSAHTVVARVRLQHQLLGYMPSAFSQGSHIENYADYEAVCSVHNIMDVVSRCYVLGFGKIVLHIHMYFVCVHVHIHVH